MQKQSLFLYYYYHIIFHINKCKRTFAMLCVTRVSTLKERNIHLQEFTTTQADLGWRFGEEFPKEVTFHLKAEG